MSEAWFGPPYYLKLKAKESSVLKNLLAKRNATSKSRKPPRNHIVQNENVWSEESNGGVAEELFGRGLR